MRDVWVPADGSANALDAVRHALREYQQDDGLSLHLLNVQPSLSRHVARFLSKGDRQGWHQQQAQAALVPAERLQALAACPSSAIGAWGAGRVRSAAGHVSCTCTSS